MDAAEPVGAANPPRTPPMMDDGDGLPPPLQIVEEAVEIFTSKAAMEARMMNKLQQFQRQAQCDSNIADVLKPYIQHSIDRKKNNLPSIRFRDFQFRILGCRLCFHPTPFHKIHECKNKCCGQKRCAKCMHVHEGVKCQCPHTTQFIIWLKDQMGR